VLIVAVVGSRREDQQAMNIGHRYTGKEFRREHRNLRTKSTNNGLRADSSAEQCECVPPQSVYIHCLQVYDNCEHVSDGRTNFSSFTSVTSRWLNWTVLSQSVSQQSLLMCQTHIIRKRYIKHKNSHSNKIEGTSYESLCCVIQ